MEINDVKVLIKSLVVSSTIPYSVSTLLKDFEKEAGVVMPTYNFRSPKDFLRSLTDTIQFVGQPPYERIRPVQNVKSKHISSLVQRQGKMWRYNHAFSHPDLFLPKEIFKEDIQQVPVEGERKRISNVEQNHTSGEKTPTLVISNKYDDDQGKGKDSEDFIFKEDEINNICKRPSFRCVSTSKKKECGDIFKVNSEISSSKSDSSHVNDNVKEKLQKLMKKQSQGIWCSDLPELYKDCYRYSLEFKEFGYRSLIEMVMELNEIFRCVRPGNSDWMLFDASRPPSQEEVDLQAAAQCKIPEYIEKNLLLLIESHCGETSKQGIYLDDLLVLYFKKFRTRLNFAELGFPNIKSLLTRLDGQILRLDAGRNRCLIKPLLDPNTISEEIGVLSITPEDELFHELFPAEVVKKGEQFPTLDMENFFSVGDKTDVNIADIWSPKKFFVQLKEFEEELLQLSVDLQLFYDKNVNKYKMPEATIQPNQVCVGLYHNEGGCTEWHRAVIVKMTKRDEVILDLVDYGNKARVETGKLRFLHRDFFSLPIHSFPAEMSSVEPAGGNGWPLEARKRFVELVTVPAVEIHVNNIDLENRVVSGELISINGHVRTNVGDKLIRQGMAVRTDKKKVEDATPLRSSAVEKSRTTVQRITDDRVNKDCGSDVEDPFKEGISSVSYEVKSGENNRVNELSALRKCTKKETRNQCNPKLMDSCEKLLAVSNDTEFQDLCTLARNLFQGGPSFRLEMDVYALAFWLLSTNQFVKKIAGANLDKGLAVALNLARKITNITKVSFCCHK